MAGEALVDLIQSPGGSLSAVPGGGPFTSARALARLGADTVFLGALSTDRFGRLLRETLVADGVDVSLAPATDAPTTLALAELDATGSARYRFYLLGTSAPALLPVDTAAVRAQPPAALHVGTLGLVLEPMADTLAGLICDLPPDTLVLVDPNCRPTAVADPVAYRRRLDAVLDRADVVKVSTEDLAYLEPGHASAVDAARALRREGHQTILLTDGGAAALAVHGGGVESVPVPPVQVVDTVGAGDTFGGAFLAAWLDGGLGVEVLSSAAALRTMVGRAVLAAALACTREGAQPPTAAELAAASTC